MDFKLLSFWKKKKVPEAQTVKSILKSASRKSTPGLEKRVSFNRSLTAEKGEEICGVFGIKQNPINAKEVDFQFDLDFTGEISTLRESLTFKMR